MLKRKLGWQNSRSSLLDTISKDFPRLTLTHKVVPHTFKASKNTLMFERRHR